MRHESAWTLAISVGASTVVTCSPPSEPPPVVDSTKGADGDVDADDAGNSPLSCVADLGGQCVTPASCPIQITGTHLCGMGSEICCTGFENK